VLLLQLRRLLLEVTTTSVLCSWSELHFASGDSEELAKIFHHIDIFQAEVQIACCNGLEELAQHIKEEGTHFSHVFVPEEGLWLVAFCLLLVLADH